MLEIVLNTSAREANFTSGKNHARGKVTSHRGMVTKCENSKLSNSMVQLEMHEIHKCFPMDHDDAQDAFRFTREGFSILKMLPRFIILLWVLGARLRSVEAQMHFGGSINRQQTLKCFMTDAAASPRTWPACSIYSDYKSACAL